MTLEEIEREIAAYEQKIADLRAQAIRLPEFRKMRPSWVRGWLEFHGATPGEVRKSILDLFAGETR